MSRTRRYHVNVYWPDVNMNVGRIPLTYSRHARLAALDDRKGPIKLPWQLDTAVARPIELEVNGDGSLHKILWRVPYNEVHDLCIAVMANGVVKTVWLNDRTDLHLTLDTERYEKK